MRKQRRWAHGSENVCGCKRNHERSNPDGTVARRDPGWEELFDFEIKFGEYLEMKNKNVKTEDILIELNNPELHNRMKRRV